MPKSVTVSIPVTVKEEIREDIGDSPKITAPTTSSRVAALLGKKATSPISVISSSEFGNENNSGNKNKNKNSKQQHPHRLTRQHSLAAFLGLFKSTSREDERASAVAEMEKWVNAVREEPEDLERSSGNNNSRSHSIPSTSIQEPRRVRRSSYHTDFLEIDSGEIAPLVTPPIMAIKKKPIAPPTARVEARRCSLTLPYAALYGSWQTTISAPGSRHGSSETSVGGGQPSRRSTVQVEMATFTSESSNKSPNFSNNVTNQAIQQQAGGAAQSPINSKIVSDSMKPSQSAVPLLCYPRFDIDPITLLACSLQKVPMKDFGSEVRASLDIVHFLQTAVLLLDVQETSLEGLTDSLLEKMLLEDEPLCTVCEAKSVLFTHDTCKYNILVYNYIYI